MRSSLPFFFLLFVTSCAQPVDKPLAAAEQPLVAEAVVQSFDSLKMDDGIEMVQAHCGACHSLALVTQNRMTREGWISTIRWMQQKQGLWDLGEAEAVIVDYLERNYGVADVPWRRKPLGQLNN